LVGGGSLTILSAYFLISIRKISPTSKEYQFLNLFGSIGIVINSLVHSALPPAGLNIIWAFIALYGLAKAIKIKIPPLK